MSEKLEAVTQAKQDYVYDRALLERESRERVEDELSISRDKLDLAIRQAVDAGESKAAVLRALGTKNFQTIKASLERTKC